MKLIQSALDIEVSALDSDEDLRKKAGQHRDEALRKATEGAVEYIWEKARQLSGVKRGGKIEIRKTASSVIKKATAEKRADFELELFKELQKERNRLAAN